MLKFKNRKTAGSKFHGFGKKKPKPKQITKIKRKPGRNEVNPGTRKRGFRLK